MSFRIAVKILSCSVLLSACQTDRLDVDVSHIGLKVDIQRFDREFFEAPKDSLHQYNRLFYNKYGQFYKRYVENVLRMGMVSDPALGYNLGSFLNDKYVKELYTDCQKRFTEMDVYEAELTDAFRHYSYYFPEKQVPAVLTYISGIQYKVVVTEGTLGIGLDMYLGSDYENYLRSGFPVYVVRGMKPSNLVADAMKGWLSTEFEPEEQPKDLFGTFVQEGKIMYLLDAMLPQTPDSLKIAYTPQQLEWCMNSEFQIWAHFVDNELLYKQDAKAWEKYVSDGPFTSGFPRESPARIGTWLGWQIVRAFMQNNPQVSIPELIQITNTQGILTRSKYKPAKR